MMIYYYSFLAICILTIIIVLAISFVLKRNTLKNRLLELRERRGDYSKIFPLSPQSMKDEIFIIENELAAKCVTK